MNDWTHETPTQDGLYWYRQAKHKARQQVTVREQKAFFDRGDTKDLADLNGLWRGPLPISLRSGSGRQDYEKSGFISRALSHLPGLIGGVLLTITAGLLLPIIQGKLSLTEPLLVFIGETPLPIMKVETTVENGRGVAFLRKSVPFKNYGLFKDHIDRVEITRDGLNELPPEVKIQRVEKTDLGWLEQSEIEFEALLYFVAVPENEKKMSFRATYYGSKGNEVYSTVITIIYVRNKQK